MTAGSHRIRIVGGGEFICSEGERILLAMERSGSSDIGVGCRGGGCGICRVRVVGGEYTTGKMSAAKISETERAAGFALACRVFPVSDLLIEVG